MCSVMSLFSDDGGGAELRAALGARTVSCDTIGHSIAKCRGPGYCGFYLMPVLGLLGVSAALDRLCIDIATPQEPDRQHAVENPPRKARRLAARNRQLPERP
jgi:hypothetical protein